MTETITPLYVFLGTKSQYIKTTPLLRLLQTRGIPYFLIDSGQHANFTSTLRKVLGIKEPDVALPADGAIDTVLRAVRWMAGHLLMILFRPARIRKTIFPMGPGICLIHGDTPSTLLAFLYAKRVRMKIAHIESGLRSYNLLKPFPEELIRVFCMRFSDYLFAPSGPAYHNMDDMGIRGEKHNIGHNTNIEALDYSLKAAPALNNIEGPYCLLTIHRVETLLSKRRLSFVVGLIRHIARSMRVFFVLHEPTRERLHALGWMESISNNPNVHIVPLMEHAHFIAWLSGAEFVITDGGSIQEECYYLGKPCLVMRSETERREGINSNVRLSYFCKEEVDWFLTNFPVLRCERIPLTEYPSQKILDVLESIGVSGDPRRLEAGL